MKEGANETPQYLGKYWAVQSAKKRGPEELPAPFFLLTELILFVPFSPELKLFLLYDKTQTYVKIVLRKDHRCNSNIIISQLIASQSALNM